MEEMLSNLESRQKELLAKVSKDDFTLWLSSPATKALLTQLQIDEFELCQNWANGLYEGDQQVKAQGQAGYIAALQETIKQMWSDQHDE